LTRFFGNRFALFEETKQAGDERCVDGALNQDEGYEHGSTTRRAC
jgi:hypothetical protein